MKKYKKKLTIKTGIIFCGVLQMLWGYMMCSLTEHNAEGFRI